mmetsp:Transcript_33025/g.52903  ORF Transcript_33025/g.52903 Transcript_33025/m.52903 type:complete len:120 (-) Transcript_33025:52-411(-)
MPTPGTSTTKVHQSKTGSFSYQSDTLDEPASGENGFFNWSNSVFRVRTYSHLSSMDQMIDEKTVKLECGHTITDTYTYQERVHYRVECPTCGEVGNVEYVNEKGVMNKVQYKVLFGTGM